MSMKRDIKCIALVAGREYVRWLVNPKMVVLAAVLLPVRDMAVVPLIRASAEMGSPLGGLESSIAVMNSWMCILLLALTYMFLMSAFPTADGNVLFYVSRMGRGNWIRGQMLFQLMCAVSYSLFVTLTAAAQTFTRSFAANGWSLVVTDYDRLYREEGSIRIMVGDLIRPNLYFQMPPVKAYVLTAVLFTLFLMFCGMSFLIGCLYRKRVLFFLLQAVHIVLGCGMVLLRSRGMWFFPLAHAMLSFHYQKYLRRYEFSPWLSLVLFGTALLAAGGVAYRKAKRVSLDMIGGDVQS